MSTYRRARVTGVESWGPGVLHAGLEFEEGGEAPAIVLEEMTGPVERGDTVVVNTTAVELGLGSGGYHFVLWNLSTPGLDLPSRGHIMKLRYTPLQFNVEAVEEQISPFHREFMNVDNALESMPVIAGSLHSQLLPVALSYRAYHPRGRLVYVMTDGGSLPIRLSRTVDFLRVKGYIQSTITCGHAFGGEYESVNIYGALVAARRVCGATAVVALMGPGIVGTGTAIGFSGMEQAAIINAAAALGAKPIAVARITFADERARHRGLSHHTITALRLGAAFPTTVGIPSMPAERRLPVWSQIEESGLDKLHEFVEVECGDVIDLIEGCGFRPTVMGRGVSEEKEYFMAAGAAGRLAAENGGDR